MCQCAILHGRIIRPQITDSAQLLRGKVDTCEARGVVGAVGDQRKILGYAGKVGKGLFRTNYIRGGMLGRWVSISVGNAVQLARLGTNQLRTERGHPTVQHRKSLQNPPRLIRRGPHVHHHAQSQGKRLSREGKFHQSEGQIHRAPSD